MVSEAKILPEGGVVIRFEMLVAARCRSHTSFIKCLLKGSVKF